MMTRFYATQSVSFLVPEQPIPIQHYLRQPQRLVKALIDPKQIEPLSEGKFRLKMRPLNFMMIQIQPIVDLQIWVEAGDTILLRSVRCEIRGNDYVNQRFDLDLTGQLTPQFVGAKTQLQGQANLEVKIHLPPAFWLTPKPLLEATGNGLLHSVLLTIKQRLMRQLLSDYHLWAATQMENENIAAIAQAGALTHTFFSQSH